jgi:hypothetical protein
VPVDGPGRIAMGEGWWQFRDEQISPSRYTHTTICTRIVRSRLRCSACKYEAIHGRAITEQTAYRSNILLIHMELGGGAMFCLRIYPKPGRGLDTHIAFSVLTAPA